MNPAGDGLCFRPKPQDAVAVPAVEQQATATVTTSCATAAGVQSASSQSNAPKRPHRASNIVATATNSFVSLSTSGYNNRRKERRIQLKRAFTQSLTPLPSELLGALPQFPNDTTKSKSSNPLATLADEDEACDAISAPHYHQSLLKKRTLPPIDPEDDRNFALTTQPTQHRGERLRDYEARKNLNRHDLNSAARSMPSYHRSQHENVVSRPGKKARQWQRKLEKWEMADICEWLSSDVGSWSKEIGRKRIDQVLDRNELGYRVDMPSDVFDFNDLKTLPTIAAVKQENGEAEGGLRGPGVSMFGLRGDELDAKLDKDEDSEMEE